MEWDVYGGDGCKNALSETSGVVVVSGGERGNGELAENVWKSGRGGVGGGNL